MVDTTLVGALLVLITTLPLAWKWGLGVRRAAVVVVALTLLSSLFVGLLGTWVMITPMLRLALVWLLTLMVAIALLAYRFYRDPERGGPNRDGVIVSPADGEVLYVRESPGGRLPVATKHGRNYTLRELTKTPLQNENTVVIGIGMSFLDVHVNRAPIAGRVTLQRHFAGRFGSLKRLEAVFENERATTVIEREGLQVAVVQIASRLVRQIAVFVCEGQRVTLGQRLGVIRLGSQVDLVLPKREDLKVMVKPGERVRAGESIVAVFEPGAGEATETSGVRLLAGNPPRRQLSCGPIPPRNQNDETALLLASEAHQTQRVSVSRVDLGTIARIVEIDPQTDARWEAFLASRLDALIYHHPAWLGVIQGAYGHQPLCLACEGADGRIRGVLPLFHTRGLLTHPRLSSLPNTPVAGPLAQDDQAMAALLCAAVERVRGRPGTSLQLKVPRAGLDGLVDSLRCVPWDTTYVLELPEHPNQLRFGDSRNHGRIKWAVNKAARLGVQVRPAETEGELQAWYGLYLDTMHRHVVPPRPYRFFRLAWERLRPQGLMRLLLAEQRLGDRSKLLAGSIFLMWRQTVFYAFNGCRREDLSLRPNDVIQWQAIGDACREGFRYYDLGEVEEHQEHLAEFKTKWGAEPRRLYRYYYPVANEIQTGILKSSSYRRQFVNAAWRRLPVKATARLGDWIYRYL